MNIIKTIMTYFWLCVAYIFVAAVLALVTFGAFSTNARAADRGMFSSGDYYNSNDYEYQQRAYQDQAANDRQEMIKLQREQLEQQRRQYRDEQMQQYFTAPSYRRNR